MHFEKSLLFLEQTLLVRILSDQFSVEGFLICTRI